MASATELVTILEWDNNLTKEGDVLKTEQRVKGCLCMLPVLFLFGHGKSTGLKLT